MAGDLGKAPSLGTALCRPRLSGHSDLSLSPQEVPSALSPLRPVRGPVLWEPPSRTVYSGPGADRIGASHPPGPTRDLPRRTDHTPRLHAPLPEGVTPQVLRIYPGGVPQLHTPCMGLRGPVPASPRPAAPPGGKGPWPVQALEFSQVGTVAWPRSPPAPVATHRPSPGPPCPLLRAGDPLRMQLEKVTAAASLRGSSHVAVCPRPTPCRWPPSKHGEERNLWADSSRAGKGKRRNHGSSERKVWLHPAATKLLQDSAVQDTVPLRGFVQVALRRAPHKVSNTKTMPGNLLPRGREGG